MCGDDFEWTNRTKGAIFGGVGGLFFGVGWWIFLNAASLHSSSTVPIPFSFYLPIIGQLLSFFMINLPAWSAISGDDSAAYDDVNRVLCINRGIVMFGLFLEMSCVAGKCVLKNFVLVIPSNIHSVNLTYTNLFMNSCHCMSQSYI